MRKFYVVLLILYFPLFFLIPVVGSVAPYYDNAYRQFYMEAAETGGTTMFAPLLACCFMISI